MITLVSQSLDVLF